MNRKALLKHLVILMFFIFLADLASRKFYWYYSIWYFDMPMHFLGGLWEGLFFIYVLSRKPTLLPSLGLFFKVVGFVFFIGISWEFFEYYSNNYIGQDPFNILDSLSDLFFDVSGGIVAYIYLMKRTMTIGKDAVQ